MAAAYGPTRVSSVTKAWWSKHTSEQLESFNCPPKWPVEHDDDDDDDYYYYYYYDEWMSFDDYDEVDDDE